MILTDISFFDLVLWGWVKSHGYTDTVVNIGFTLAAFFIGAWLLSIIMTVIKHKFKNRRK